jgi:DNA-binding SARP family transcriptional activator
MGGIGIRCGDADPSSDWLAGRQVRLSLAYLCLHAGEEIPRKQLAAVVWDDAPPVSSDSALRNILTRTRKALAGIGAELESYRRGTVSLHLPRGAVVDVVHARAELARAEALITEGSGEVALYPAASAATVLTKPFLPGEDAAWAHRVRNELAWLGSRALAALGETSLRVGDHVGAVNAGAALMRRDQLDETGYQLLMRGLFAQGNRAEALRVYARCRRLLAAELGVDPSSETERIYLWILTAPRPSGSELPA